MKVEILIFSIVRDIPYLEYCLRSILKFATGFTGVTIGVPIQEKDEFLSKAPKFYNGLNIDGKGEFQVKFYTAPDDREKWHLAHQAEKCRADLYVPTDTDFVFFMDSDCFFIEPVTPNDYIVNGKPILCIEEYRTMTERPWREQTSAVLGIDAKFETMRRHGAIHYTEMFPDFRTHIEHLHKKPFMDYVMSLKADFPWGISEFNALGNYVLNSGWALNSYQFVDVGKSGYPPDKMLDLWCHSPLTEAQPGRYRGKFPGTMTALDIFKELGL